MITASAGLEFASDPPLLFWVGRFMMMVDAERSRNRKVFGDLKFDGANEDEQWDPNSDLPQRNISVATIEKAKVDPLRRTLVTGPDCKVQRSSLACGATVPFCP